jgi:MraZ protein
MTSFKGSEVFTIDPKGRVKFPAKMLKSIPEAERNNFVVTRGMDKCVYAYPQKIWDETFTKVFSERNQFDNEDRMMMRGMLEWSEEMQLDTQQRIMLTRELMELAAITDKVKIIGVFDHVEFWNPDEYEKYKKQQPGTFEEIVERVMTEKDRPV